MASPGRSSKDAKPEEDFGENVIEEVRSSLRDLSKPIRGAKLRAALRRAFQGVEKGHRTLTTIWGQPLSLFSKSAEMAASVAGVPRASIDAVRQAADLVDAAAGLSDLTDAYEAQVAIAYREDRGLRADHLASHLSACEELAGKLQAHVASLQAARADFERVQKAKAAAAKAKAQARVKANDEVEPPATSGGGGSSSSSAAAPAGAAAAAAAAAACCDGAGAASATTTSELGPTVILEPSKKGMGIVMGNFQKLWRGVQKHSNEYLPKALEFGVDVVKFCETTMHGGHSFQPPSRALTWEKTEGVVAPWLDVSDADRAKQQCLVWDSDDLNVLETSYSRWHRTKRRGDRRWTIA